MNYFRLKHFHQMACVKWISLILLAVSSLLLSACDKEPAASAPMLTSLKLLGESPSGEAVLGEPVIEEIPARELLIAERAFIRVAKQVTPAVVNISSIHFVRHPTRSGKKAPGFGNFLKDFFKRSPRQFQEKSLGSGFLISKEGYILTNHHVVADADQITIRLSDRREFMGVIVGKDAERDLALIKIPPNRDLPVAQLGSSRQIDVGQWAIAIGNPFGLDRTVTVGVISATGRNGLGLSDTGHFLQTDASINFGNSGGPLLNVAGRVIGINTAIVASGQGIGFAIPIDAVKAIMRNWVDVAQL